MPDVFKHLYHTLWIVTFFQFVRDVREESFSFVTDEPYVKYVQWEQYWHNSGLNKQFEDSLKIHC